MRTLLWLAVVGCCASSSAADVPQIAAGGEQTPAVQSVAFRGGWRRAERRGTWAAQPSQNGSANSGNAIVQQPNAGAKTGSAATQPTPAGPTRIYTYYRPNVVTTTPDDDKPVVVNGVDWYLNGRSFFSD